MKQIVGAIFCLLAGILYAANFVAAVSLMPQVTNFSTPPGRQATAYNIAGRTPEYLACIAMAIGIVFVVLGELSRMKSKKMS